MERIFDMSFDTVESTDNSTVECAIAQDEHTPPHTPAQAPAHLDARYTAQAIAEKYFVKDVTIRTRWFAWLAKVAPEYVLKDDKGYTQLAADLFEDYATAVKRDQMRAEDWVESAKPRFAGRWEETEDAIDGELLEDFMPKEIGGMLSTIQSQTIALNTFLDKEMESIDKFIEEMGIATQELTEADLNHAKTVGAARGAARFKAEVITETATYNALRQKYADRVQQSQSKGESKGDA